MNPVDESQMVPVYNIETPRKNIQLVIVPNRTARNPHNCPQRPDANHHSSRQRLGDDAEMVQEIDQLIAFRQSRAKDFDYLPHPAVARGFFADFGFRGLSIRHFAPMDVKVERDNLKSYDMTDFSAKNNTPEPQEPKDLADVVAALEVLSLLVNEMYTQVVADLVDAAGRFLLTLPAQSIRTHFQLNHESYARVVQRVTSLKVEAALKLSASRKPSSRMKKAKARTTIRGARQGHGVPVPPKVVAALLIRKGKKLCMKKGFVYRKMPWSVGWPKEDLIPEVRDVVPLQSNCKSVQGSNESRCHGVGRKERGHEMRTVVSGELQIFLTGQQRRYTLTLLASERGLGPQRHRARDGLASIMKHYGVAPPTDAPAWGLKNRSRLYQIDRAKQYAYCALLRRSKMGLPYLIRLVRGETSQAPRPNKGPDYFRSYSLLKNIQVQRRMARHCDASRQAKMVYNVFKPNSASTESWLCIASS
ncbi:uncharacterized protein PITG_21041 [Phytophthora infestans T30-4]|uniref:Uncharacterized protein n=1 Tax=Phytophthora infestans (strain T30-4) TaxID=403677 RepID=D0P3G9_PHYIT|nr:uncharacterized protein PITG_21041 [Phytophthora infestans T30-4]EEY59755.1 conserved hypothetical protein [Phytophthora infestans T30-4]|eukprot:XP_002895157.1 conserved hypothetical protein [Phytophthora infestans T30-4]